MNRQHSVARVSRKSWVVLGIALLALLVLSFPEEDPQPEVSPSIASDLSTAKQQPKVTKPAKSGVPAGSYTLHGTVSNVADGDTVTFVVNGQSRRLRLDSIDAPEADHGSREPGQPYAQASQRYLQNLVGGKTLTAQCYERDQYDREVCALIMPDGESANRKMVESGYAWAYTARRGEYLRDQAMPGLQSQAREAGLGLWAQGGQTQPWTWRYECWRNQRC